MSRATELKKRKEITVKLSTDDEVVIKRLTLPDLAFAGCSVLFAELDETQRKKKAREAARKLKSVSKLIDEVNEQDAMLELARIIVPDAMIDPKWWNGEGSCPADSVGEEHIGVGGLLEISGLAMDSLGTLEPVLKEAALSGQHFREDSGRDAAGADLPVVEPEPSGGNEESGREPS